MHSNCSQYTEAVDLCLQNNVELNETLVERLTPLKDQTPSSGTREQLLMKLGDCCMKQGAYHLACKKYTQAGDRERVRNKFVWLEKIGSCPVKKYRFHRASIDCILGL